MRTFIALTAIAALAACTQETTTETPAEPAQVVTPAPAPSVVVVTESDARTRAEAAGYSNITGLTQNADGTWTATGTQNGQTTQFSVGEGGVTVVTTPAP